MTSSSQDAQRAIFYTSNWRSRAASVQRRLLGWIGVQGQLDLLGPVLPGNAKCHVADTTRYSYK